MQDDEEIIEPPDEGPTSTECNDEGGSDDETWGDRTLSHDRPLSPRHRKLAELLAQGKSNAEICATLGMSGSRVSVLKSNTRIRELTMQIAERIYEETVGGRLKKLAEPALNEIEKCINDRTNRYKEQLKVDTSKWIVEMNHGKAKQTHDIGENMLSVVMDRLDALKNAGQSLDNAPRNVIELTPQVQIEGNSPENPAEVQDDYLKSWIADFTSLKSE